MRVGSKTRYAGKRALPGMGKAPHSAPILFEVKDWFAFFEKYGCVLLRQLRTSRNRSASIDLSRRFPYGVLMRAIPKECGEKYGLSAWYDAKGQH